MSLRYIKPKRITENTDIQHLVSPVMATTIRQVEIIGDQDIFWQFNTDSLGKLTEFFTLPMWWEIYHGKQGWCQAVPERPQPKV